MKGSELKLDTWADFYDNYVCDQNTLEKWYFERFPEEAKFEANSRDEVEINLEVEIP